MLKKLINLSLLAVALSFSCVAAGQAQVLVANTATTANSGNVYSLGNSGTSGIVNSNPFTANLNGINVNVSFTGTSAIVNGNTGYGWEPVVSGSNMVGNYLSAISGNVNMSLSTNESTWSMVWGSVDRDNTLSFYNGNTVVGQFTGAQILAQTHGNAAYSTAYATVSFGGGITFNKVVASAGQPFEFALLTKPWAAPTSTGGYSITSSVPAPMPPLGATLFGNVVAMSGMAALWNRRRNKSRSAG